MYCIIITINNVFYAELLEKRFKGEYDLNILRIKCNQKCLDNKKEMLRNAQ